MSAVFPKRREKRQIFISRLCFTEKKFKKF